MSQENVELARLGYEAFSDAVRAGEDLGELIRQTHHPDVVIEMGVLEGTFRGHDGVLRFLQGQLETVEDLRMDPEDPIAAGQQVIVPFRLSGRIRSTGLSFDAHYVHLVTLRDGKVAHVRLFASVRNALKAAGLRE